MELVRAAFQGPRSVSSRGGPTHMKSSIGFYGFSPRKALNGQPVRLALRRGSLGQPKPFPGRESLHASPGVGKTSPPRYRGSAHPEEPS